MRPQACPGRGQPCPAGERRPPRPRRPVCSPRHSVAPSRQHDRLRACVSNAGLRRQRRPWRCDNSEGTSTATTTERPVSAVCARGGACVCSRARATHNTLVSSSVESEPVQMAAPSSWPLQSRRMPERMPACSAPRTTAKTTRFDGVCTSMNSTSFPSLPCCPLPPKPSSSHLTSAHHTGSVEEQWLGEEPCKRHQPIKWWAEKRLRQRGKTDCVHTVRARPYSSTVCASRTGASLEQDQVGGAATSCLHVGSPGHR